MLKQSKTLPLIMSDFPIFGIGNGLYFNNKLSFLKSVTTLIVQFFLGIANDGHMESHSEE
jgi:hypothetical protein